MRFRPANISLINSRSTPPTPLAAIVIQSCNIQLSEIPDHILVLRLTGPSITGCVKRSETHHHNAFYLVRYAPLHAPYEDSIPR